MGKSDQSFKQKDNVEGPQLSEGRYWQEGKAAKALGKGLCSVMKGYLSKVSQVNNSGPRVKGATLSSSRNIKCKSRKTAS